MLDSLFAEAGALDFFVSFGSSWPVIGAPYAGHFVAASHFQDVFAQDRARRGLPALTVDWGWWEGASLAAANGKYFRFIGYPPLGDELGFSALGRLIASGAVQATVAPAGTGRSCVRCLRPDAHAPLLEAIFAATDTGGQDTELLDKLRAAGGVTRSRLIEDAIQTEIAALLGQPDGSRMDRELGFFNAGMDSITSVDLRGRLENRLGVTLSPTVAFEHPGIADLAGFLLEELFSGTEAGTGGAPGRPRANRTRLRTRGSLRRSSTTYPRTILRRCWRKNLRKRARMTTAEQAEQTKPADGAGSEQERKDLLRRALLEVKTARAKADALQLARTEPIAVVGIDSFFPAGWTVPRSSGTCWSRAATR